MLLVAESPSTEVAEQRVLLGQRLVAEGKLSARDLDRALAAQRETGGLLGRVLVRLGLVTELDVAQALAAQTRLPLLLADAFPAVLPVIKQVAPAFFRTHRILPLDVRDETLQVVMATPQDEFALQALRLATGLKISTAIGIESEIDAALARGLEDEGEEGSDADQLDAASASDFVEHLRDLASEAPVIRLVNVLIGRVTDLRASDIHLEPFDDGLHVRYRIDGVIDTYEVIEPRLAAAVVSRMKLLAQLNIAERRLPQDGRIKTRVKGRELDLRVSTVPTVHGESVVLRVLDRASVRFSLADLGFSPDTLAGFEALLARPHGILLVTGPTGSGKTTTLYGALSKLDANALKILTVEDPVEYQLDGINQIHVHPQIGLTFASALRSILRQDPDIIMIGEMRDGETAQIAVQSALTGHLVLSTLHTNTAASAVVRMTDMGVERYLITSTVNGVLSQRLVRRLCQHCRRPADLPAEVVASSGLARVLQPGQAALTAPGCAHCRGTGYWGRSAIHELLLVDDVIREAILRGADASQLHELARRGSLVTLYEDGLRKVAAGATSLEEVMRVTQDQSDG
ncbi:MAG: Flp pilus assembly complex ATPase component TadA [Burkholderiales bacterium]|nr:MAG: Flp pilus assembly complex ATPase component TadA [Burkholderiales bacterium]